MAPRRAPVESTVEDALDRVVDEAHDETVAERHLTLRAGARKDPASRQEAEIPQDPEETLAPHLRLTFDRGDARSDPPPGGAEIGFGREGLIIAVARPPHELRQSLIGRCG